MKKRSDFLVAFKITCELQPLSTTSFGVEHPGHVSSHGTRCRPWATRSAISDLAQCSYILAHLWFGTKGRKISSVFYRNPHAIPLMSPLIVQAVFYSGWSVIPLGNQSHIRVVWQWFIRFIKVSTFGTGSHSGSSVPVEAAPDTCAWISPPPPLPCWPAAGVLLRVSLC